MVLRSFRDTSEVIDEGQLWLVGAGAHRPPTPPDRTRAELRPHMAARIFSPPLPWQQHEKRLLRWSVFSPRLHGSRILDAEHREAVFWPSSTRSLWTFLLFLMFLNVFHSVVADFFAAVCVSKNCFACSWLVTSVVHVYIKNRAQTDVKPQQFDLLIRFCFLQFQP